jgi:hypothetical protein
VGATTRPALLSAPLRARFGVTYHLDFYDLPAGATSTGCRPGRDRRRGIIIAARARHPAPLRLRAVRTSQCVAGRWNRVARRPQPGGGHLPDENDRRTRDHREIPRGQGLQTIAGSHRGSRHDRTWSSPTRSAGLSTDPEGVAPRLCASAAPPAGSRLRNLPVDSNSPPGVGDCRQPGGCGCLIWLGRVCRWGGFRGPAFEPADTCSSATFDPPQPPATLILNLSPRPRAVTARGAAGRGSRPSGRYSPGTRRERPIDYA